MNNCKKISILTNQFCFISKCKCCENYNLQYHDVRIKLDKIGLQRLIEIVGQYKIKRGATGIKNTLDIIFGPVLLSIRPDDLPIFEEVVCIALSTETIEPYFSTRHQKSLPN